MNKFKNLTYIALAILMLLLVMGNWVTPVQANNIAISTPLPTNMPVPATDTPRSTVSEQQQEELKAVIRSYFEIRYQSLSVLQPDGFQLNGFGSLVSDRIDARNFLNAELGKLAVERKHAELNHLRYTEYKFFLDFRNISVDASDQMATVSVIEAKDVVYELSGGRTPKKPIVSRSYDMEHTIILRKEQSRWSIVSDDYTDYLWQMLRRTGKSMDEILRTMKASPNLVAQSKNTETTSAYVAPDDASSHSYDRAGAVEYALAHVQNENYNPNYPTYTGLGGDCTNFVSQAIYEGGNASMYIPTGPLPPPSNDGQVGWYLLDDKHRATAWNDVGSFYTYVTDYLWSDAYGDGPEGRTVGINELELGDVIQYEAGGDTTWDHAVIVVGFDEDGDPLVASHSENYAAVPYDFFDYYLNSPDHIRFIHIERSNGYLPIKVEITARADDWGPNLYDNCTDSTITTNNEIYFGACPANGSSITSGFRFNNIQIPLEADLKYAYITFTIDGPYYWNTEPIFVNIYEQTNPLTPIAWNIDGVVSHDYDNWAWRGKRTTPDLQNILESVIGVEGWNSGQSLSIMFTNNGSVNVRRVMAIDRKLGTIYPPDPNLQNYWTARLIAAYSGDASTLPPSVLSVTRASANPTNAASVNFTVTFSEPVTGVDSNDFTLTTTGVSGTSIANVSGSDNIYTVAVNTGRWSGTIRLDVVDNDTIIDATSNPLSGGFTGGETYTIDKTEPMVISITRLSANPTNASSVQFRVTFSETVTGVDVSDFTLYTAGVSGATVTSVSGSGSTYIVTVNTGNGDGTIRLDVLNATATIADLVSNPLVRSFTSGQVYTVIKTSH